MTYRFEWILKDIRAGKTYPDRWPEKKPKKPAKPTTRKGAPSAKKGHR